MNETGIRPINIITHNSLGLSANMITLQGQKCLGWVIFGWKPRLSSKFRPILDSHEPLTYFH